MVPMEPGRLGAGPRDVSGRDPPVARRPAALHAWLNGKRIYEAIARRPIAVSHGAPGGPALLRSLLPLTMDAGTGTAGQWPLI